MASFKSEVQLKEEVCKLHVKAACMPDAVQCHAVILFRFVDGINFESTGTRRVEKQFYG